MSYGKEWGGACKNGEFTTTKKRRGEGAMSNCHSGFRNHCYLLGHSQKSSLPQHVLPHLQRRWSKQPAGQTRKNKKNVNRRKYEGLCEVEVNRVGSSSAADWGLCLQEICWNPPLPASQGSCKGINQDFIQAGPDTLTMSQSSKNKNYSWGNKVSHETSYFSMETIYVIDQE